MTIKNRVCTPMVNALANHIRMKIEKLEKEIDGLQPTWYALRTVLERDRHELSCILEDMVEVYPELAK